MWIPEAFFRLPDTNECIDISKIPRSKFGHKCCYCNKTHGATLDCCQANCIKTYHVSCAIKQKVCKYKIL